MNNSIYTEENHFEALLKAPKEKKYDSYSVTYTYITMRDGVRIAADIHLPDGLPILFGNGQYFLGYMESFFEWIDRRYVFHLTLEQGLTFDKDNFDISIICSLSE